MSESSRGDEATLPVIVSDDRISSLFVQIGIQQSAPAITNGVQYALKIYHDKYLDP